MNQIQGLVAGTSSATYGTGVLSASSFSAVQTCRSVENDAAESHGKAASHRTGAVGQEAISRRLLARTHFAPSSIELQARDTSSAQARVGAWWTLVDDNGQATACSASATTAAAELLRAAHGDPSKALAMAVESRDACTAMVLSNGQADALAVTRTFIDRHQWDEMAFIVDQKLMRTHDVATVIDDAMRMPDHGHVVLRLCDMDRAAAQHLLARYALNGDAAGLNAFLGTTSLETEIYGEDVLVDIAKMTDHGRAERIDAMRLIQSTVYCDAAYMLQRQSAQGEQEVVELLIAAGVPALDTP